MEKSLKQIIYETNVLIDAHVQLRSFYYGDLLDIIKIGSIDYASCFLSINSASNNANFETFNLELFVFDILASDDSNRTDIENTTKRILNDLITVIRYSTRWNDFSEVLSDVSELKYYDNLQDRLSGWGATLQLKVYSNDCLIGLPIDDYDFDMAGNFELTVLAIVKNTDNDILATKLVSDNDDTIIIPNIKVIDSDGSQYEQAAGTEVICTPCLDATVENSDATYTDTVASGGTLVLPDITVTDSDGSTFTQPSVTDVVCTPGGGSGDVRLNGTNIGTYTAPNTFSANVTLDGTESGTWNSETSTWEVVSDPCLDATYQIEDTDDNILYSGSIVSGGNLAQVIQNSTVTITDDSANTLYTVSTLAEGSNTQVIQDSTAVLKNTDNTILSTTSINAEASADIIAPDGHVHLKKGSGGTIDNIFVPSGVTDIYTVANNDIEVNGVFEFDIYATEPLDIRLRDTVGAVVTPNSITEISNHVTIVMPDATVENSDASYTDTVVSGGSLILPDITVTDSDGSTYSQPSVNNVTCTPCADATYDLEDSLGGLLSSGSIPSGANDVIVAPNATVENSNTSYLDTVVSGGTLILPDTDIEVNGIFEGVIPSAATADIQVTDGVSSVTPTSVVVSGYTVTIEVPSGGAPVGATLMKTGQTTSYRTGDDGDLEIGRATNFFTLASNNPFGNLNRFTDELGTQTYTNNIVIDWSTYDGSTVLGYYRIKNGSNVLWNVAIDDSLLISVGTYTTGWRLPNIYELQNICNFSIPTTLNYAPFTLGLSGSINLWCSTTNPASVGQAYRLSNLNVFAQANKTGGGQYIPCRTFTVTGTILT